MSFYQEWLDQGLSADMTYLHEHFETKKNLKNVLPDAQSAIVLTHSYFNHPHPHASVDEWRSHFQIAKYAQGVDYHYWFKDLLEKACEKLRAEHPSHHFIAATDSQPILERDFAYQAGLGWFGKNTCIIHSKKGSFFLIGEIITTLPANKTTGTSSEVTLTPHPDRCGKCTRCIDACPTSALSAPTADKSATQLDARKCISYWTIESKTTPPLELAQKFGTWFFGCDICQSVCPWNEKVFGYKHSENTSADFSTLDREKNLNAILEILKASNKSLEKKLKGSPLTRARGFGLKRNALVVALNMQATELIADLEALDLGERLNAFKDQITESLKSHHE